LDVSRLRIVVLDEADEMLDLGFRDDLEFILDAAPTERRSLLFSATLAREITALARRYQRDAIRIDTTSKSQPHGDIEYRAVRVAPNDAEHAVVNLLRYFEAPGALVFCATREGVRRLHGRLVERGFAAVALSGEMSQSERNHALQSLRDGRARVCVATDVAARGLDLPDLGLVIHADLPTNRAALLHRSGRTGRAGKKGVSVLVVPYTRRRQAETLLGHTHAQASWSGAPTAEEIRVRDQDRWMADPVFAEDPAEEDQVMAAALLAQFTPERLAAALARLRRQSLPSPEELFDEPAPPRRDERPSREPVRHGEGDGVWFRMTVGRAKNADPKWLIPLICRLGHVTKRDIGAIRIFAHESRFEIMPGSAQRFASAVRNAAEDDIRIEPSEAPPAADAKRPKPYLKRKIMAGGPAAGRKTGGKPRRDG
jgi:ATP-dependent RNA helicase DeaD